MTWYTVSLISAVITKSSQDEFPIFEDFFLFCAETDEELQRKIARETALIDQAGSCTYKGMPATKKCLGVRKIRSVYNDVYGDVDTNLPSDGTELTHSFYMVRTLEDAMRLAKGMRVVVDYVDDDDADDDVPPTSP